MYSADHVRAFLLKVLVVSSKYLPEYSGSGLRVHQTYERLSRKFGIDREVICSSTGTSTSESYDLDGVNVERIVSSRLRKLNRKLAATPARRASNLVLFHTESRAVKKALSNREFDVIHTIGYSPATATAIRWSRDHAIPLLEELVNLNALPYQYLPGVRRFSPYNLQKHSVIVAISRHLAETCRKYGLNENVWTRPNPVDSQRFRPASIQDRANARKQISPKSNDQSVLIVYVAKYLERKNHSFLIDVLSNLPENYRLLLAGPPLMETDLVPGLRKEQLTQLDEKAVALNVQDRVEVTAGFADMREHLAAADVFCFPAENEGMGTPLLESISMGVPVVANAGEPSFQEWVIEDQNGYLRPLEPEKWAEAIVSAANMGDKNRVAMSNNIKDKTSSETIDDQYKEILTALVESSPNDTLNVDEILAR